MPVTVCRLSVPVMHLCPKNVLVVDQAVSQVENLQSTVRDRRANWKQSMAALKLAKESGARVTKSSIMLGCGEQPEEVLHTFRTLRDSGKERILQ